MPNLLHRIKGTSRVAIGCVGLATMAVAAPHSTCLLPTQEQSVQEAQADKQAAPDNSRKNKRDREDKTLTPKDQGGSAEDTKMTRDIRKEIYQTKGISMNGKNVKIITIDGVVTLRGPVASAKEKEIITDIAGKIAGPAKVKNQLEVK